jgi:hypothetical protein
MRLLTIVGNFRALLNAELRPDACPPAATTALGVWAEAEDDDAGDPLADTFLALAGITSAAVQGRSALGRAPGHGCCRSSASQAHPR